ncbi:MAG: hypothetical protein ACNA8W_17305, partial [Bradymonadaceae bacterium]
MRAIHTPKSMTGTRHWLAMIILGLSILFAGEGWSQDDAADEDGQDTAEVVDAAAESEAAPEDDPSVPEDTRRPQAILVEDFGLDPEKLKLTGGLEEYAGAIAADLEFASERRREIGREESRTERLATSMRHQVSRENLPDEARLVFALELVPALVYLAILESEREHIEAAEVRNLRMSELLGAQRDELRVRLEADVQSTGRMQQAEMAEQSAMRLVEAAREREVLEQNQQIRTLLARERELAEELAAVAREEAEQLRRLSEERRQRAETFAERRVKFGEA